MQKRYRKNKNINEYTSVKYAIKNRVYINLQLFAEGDKTEKATPKKRKDARQKGQVLSSREISGSLELLVALVSVRILGSNIYFDISAFMKRVFEQYLGNSKELTLNVVANIGIDLTFVIIKTSGIIMLIVMAAGVFINIAQVGFLFTTEPLRPNFERINPFSGIKRIFSLRSFVELIKSVIKLFAVSYVVYSSLKDEMTNILSLVDVEVFPCAVYVATLAVDTGIKICIVLLILGIADYVYQWWEYEKSLRMTKQEIKEEYKQTEGNPEIKSKIRQKQRQISMRRMLSEVPKADVVITNPTHFAVAIMYNSNVNDAPLVVAKGMDFMAHRIKEIAKEHKVEIVENKPLARALYDACQVGEAIPPEMYKAVAEVLAYVYSLKGQDKVG